MANNLD